MRARYWDYKILDKIRKVKDIKRHFIAIFALTRMHLVTVQMKHIEILDYLSKKILKFKSGNENLENEMGNLY